MNSERDSEDDIVQDIQNDVKLLQQIDSDFEEFNFTELTEDEIAYLEDQKKTVEKIAKDVQQLNEMMYDLNNIVILQGEDINIVDNTVYNTQELIEGGKNELEKAEIYQSKYRKKLLGLSVGAVVGGALFGAGGVAVLGTTNAIISSGVGGSAGAVIGYFGA